VAPIARDACWQPKASLQDATLESLWALDDAGLEGAIEGTALRRAGVRGLRRNLAVAIGNAGRSRASALLPGTVPGKVPGTFSSVGRASQDDPMVAEHVTWARSRPR